MLSNEEIGMFTGAELEYKDVADFGNHLPIPAGAHVAVNYGQAKPAVFIGFRKESTAQESFRMFLELAYRVP